MRALVTGAAGFAGGHLCRALVAEGHQVCGTAERFRGPEADTDRTSIRWIEFDITDPGQVASVVADVRPEITFHLAAATFVPESLESPYQTYAVNFNGTLHLLEALRKSSKSRFVYVSSSEIYGAPKYLPVDEEHPLAPVTPYSGSKAAADLLCFQYAKSFGMDVVRLRPFNHTGPGQSDRFVISSFARQLVEIEKGLRPPVLRVGNLDSRRDFSDVRDVVRGYVRAAQEATSPDVFNLCSGVAFTVRELLEEMLALADMEDLSIETDPHKIRKEEIAEVRGSFDKALRELGWSPSISITETLKACLESWRKRVDKAHSPGAKG